MEQHAKDLEVDDLVCRNGDIVIWGPKGHGMGRVATFHDETGSPDEVLPNARLYAAAPQMYDLCKEALFDLEQVFTTTHEIVQKLRDMVKSLTRKEQDARPTN